MYVYDFFNHVETIVNKPSDKIPFLIQKFNRTDNFINLALYGAQKCVGKEILLKNSTIYLASISGNMNTTLKVFDAIFFKNKLPMPFNFLNSVNAAKLFYIAKSFELEGKALFVDRFESALPQAFVDIQNNKTSLVGVVTEGISDLKLHEKCFGNEVREEESRWLLLSQSSEKKEALAHISNLKFNNDKRKDTISKLFEFLEEGEVGTIFHFQGDNLSFTIKKLKSKEL